MASCSNHRLLKIAQLSKGKLWSPGRPCLTLTSDFWILGAWRCPLATTGARIYRAPPENGGLDCRTLNFSKARVRIWLKEALRQSWQLSPAWLDWNLKASRS